MAAWLVRLLVALALLGPGAQAAELQLFTEENPPLNFSRAGRADGLASAVVEELLRRTGDTASIQVVPWARGYKMARTTPNAGLFVAVRTPEREALFKWVGPVVSTTTSFYGRRGAGLRIASLEDARRVAHIAVPREWYSHQVLRGLGFGNLDLVPKPHEMARMILHERAALMVYEDQLLPSLLAEIGASMAEVERVYTFMRTSSYIVFSLGTADALVQRWQRALDEMKGDGSFARIHGQWLPGEPPPGLVADKDLLPTR
ncbi:MAG: substrate-binding periplasmic protein [Pseudomonas sp.]